MRNSFADTFHELGQRDPRLCIVVADISPAGSIQKFRDAFPERFVNTGVAEQVMIGMTAGMAMRGLRPFAYTIATFALYRPFEMVRNDLAYQNLPVTIVGIGGGVAYSVLGGTHHAQEDVAIACGIPNLSVISPCDPLEVEAATRHCAVQTGGPIYMRLGKAGEPVLTRDAPDPFLFGKLRFLRRVPGAETCILAHGGIMRLAQQAADALAERGEPASLVSVHTLKPLDSAGLRAILASYRRVVVIEETSCQNGLGPMVKRIAWDMDADTRLHHFALRDEFTHVHGSHADVLASHGLTLENILAALDQRPAAGRRGRGAP
ncbi:1-deoxy-D-xylulose-5-phosphate synthase [Skermanella stibiiresistens SB22]|uniref:1-deoxy-D-xylulose-5-phosphate synthase n=1 Tax=Skermanella stibiiresistens SB22 TaxID=1385369 RepID=W9HF39_9PROT|nr:transketolase C-terminal domain-containing protein [Skermanella stibiiresistens]EWY42518.1 1-deoxy-D-xylulose-5-phosphate synthase [Skermanella stibiiresistens SB22]